MVIVLEGKKTLLTVHYRKFLRIDEGLVIKHQIQTHQIRVVSVKQCRIRIGTSKYELGGIKRGYAITLEDSIDGARQTVYCRASMARELLNAGSQRPTKPIKPISLKKGTRD